MFPWRDKKERHRKQWEHRCLSLRVRRKPLAAVIITANPRPSASSEMSRLEVLETASSSLIGNWLHVLYWKPFPNNCLQMTRPNALLSFGTIRVFKQHWSPCMGVNSMSELLTFSLETSTRFSRSIFPKCPQDCHPIAGPSSILACLVSDARYEKLWEV